MTSGSETPVGANAAPARLGFLLARGIAWLGVIALVWVGLDQLRPPECPGTTKDAAAFSCERALGFVREIAVRPHSTGSAANDDVREFLLDELRAMGLTPQVQNARWQTVSHQPVEIHNIVVRLPGTTHGPALLLGCHYDSVPMGPGASDDGVAVGVLLETLRALKAGPPLRNDVILLISDGEELWMLGASAFVAEHPWAKDVGFVLNFDARGTDGPSIMFQTSAGNAAMVRQFKAAAPYPVATSLADDVYRHMPNDTDFTIFTRAGMKGLNFAFIGNYVYYHTPGDNLRHVSPDTVYQTGTYALTLARQFGNQDLSALPAGPGAPSAVYFTALRGVLTVYGQAWVWPLTVLLLVLTAAAILVAYRRRWITGWGLGESILRLLVSLIVAMALVYGTVWGIGRPVLRRWPDAWTPGFVLGSAIVFTLIALGVAWMSAMLLRKRAGALDLAAAGALLWALIGIPVAAMFPGGSYLVFWPALLALGGFVVATKCRCGPWARVPVVLIASAPALVLMSPSIDLFYTALTFWGSWLVAPMIVLTFWLLITSGCVELLGLGTKELSRKGR